MGGEDVADTEKPDRVWRPSIYEVGIQIRDIRRASRWSQAELAAKVRMKQPEISELEHGRGNPTLDTLERLADAMGARVHVRLNPSADMERRLRRNGWRRLNERGPRKGSAG